MSPEKSPTSSFVPTFIETFLQPIDISEQWVINWRRTRKPAFVRLTGAFYVEARIIAMNAAPLAV